MAERLADGGELAVDELKRKARRRLVGAIVLALTAAIIVPMLLEDEPRSLGDDVSVQIPARDESKFVNRLTGAVPDNKAPMKGAASREPKAPQADREAKPAPGDGEAKQSPRADAETTPVQAAGPVVATVPTAPPAATAATPGMRKPLAEAEQRVLAPAAKPAAKATPTQGTAEPRAEPESKPAAEAKPVAVPATPAAPTANEFVVQLAAFADDKGANALANKLKRANYAAYVEPVTTSRGTLWRVRVGGYASRPDADAARVKLKDEGYSGIVAPAK